MLDKLLFIIGYKQKWHISWIAKIPGKETSFGDGVYTFNPRLTAVMIEGLRGTLAHETGDVAGIDVKAHQINITNMVRLGG